MLIAHIFWHEILWRLYTGELLYVNYYKSKTRRSYFENVFPVLLGKYEQLLVDTCTLQKSLIHYFMLEIFHKNLFPVYKTRNEAHL